MNNRLAIIKRCDKCYERAMEAQTKDTYPDFLKKVMSEPSLEECVEIGQVNKDKVKKEKGVPGRHNRGLETGDPNQDGLAGA